MKSAIKTLGGLGDQLSGAFDKLQKVPDMLKDKVLPKVEESAGPTFNNIANTVNNDIYPPAREIINPTICEKITLMCTLAQKVQELQN